MSLTISNILKTKSALEGFSSIALNSLLYSGVKLSGFLIPYKSYKVTLKNSAISGNFSNGGAILEDGAVYCLMLSSEILVASINLALTSYQEDVILKKL